MSFPILSLDDFTVGADINLDTRDTQWEKITDGAATWVGVASVRASTDDVRNTGTSNTAVYRWIGRTVVDQMVRASILAAATHDPGLYVRLTSTQGYLAEWDVDLGTIVLSRVTAINTTPVFTTLASGGVVTGATYHGAFLSAVGNVITFGDNTNGAFRFVDPTPILVGQPGISLWNVAALSVSIDNLEIWNACPSKPRAWQPLGRRRHR
jgi:hypothetical protein